MNSRKTKTTASSPEAETPTEQTESAQVDAPVEHGAVSAEDVALLEVRITAGDAQFNETHDTSNVNPDFSALGALATTEEAAIAGLETEQQQEEVDAESRQQANERREENNRDGLDEEDI